MEAEGWGQTQLYKNGVNSAWLVTVFIQSCCTPHLCSFPLHQNLPWTQTRQGLNYFHNAASGCHKRGTLHTPWALGRARLSHRPCQGAERVKAQACLGLRNTLIRLGAILRRDHPLPASRPHLSALGLGFLGRLLTWAPPPAPLGPAPAHLAAAGEVPGQVFSTEPGYPGCFGAWDGDMGAQLSPVPQKGQN